MKNIKDTTWNERAARHNELKKYRRGTSRDIRATMKMPLLPKDASTQMRAITNTPIIIWRAPA